MKNATMGRMIDHNAYSGLLNSPNYTKVLKLVDLSDHMPVISEWNIESIKSPVSYKRIDTAKMTEQGTRLNIDSRSATVASHESITENFVNSVTASVWEAPEELGALKTIKAVYGPMFDKNRQLVTESEIKAEVWAARFEELAKDSTGNSISAEKWSDIGSDSTDVFTECDTPLSWAEICAALKSTPNNKSPGSDGIPSEAWKLVQDEDEPTSPFEKLLLRLIN
ncbi:hypothetical protein AYI69_g5035 [Smittium culicis]|uniref:Uncharacterized protein n=1 Tax=Smittium culicis TaxID=133412 RepID=A0A1R1Y8S9_9FUNG|nr:hypothetical protein AYI69_g5035 [Smittium culicis]